MAHPPKIDRKELKKPDEFVQLGNRALGLIESNRKAIALALVACLLGGIGYYGYTWWRDGQVEKGWVAYYDASKATGEQKWKDLEKVQSSYGSVRPGFLAAIALADYHFDNAKKEALKPADAAPESIQAATWYRKALEFSGLEPTEMQLVRINLGSALEMGGKLDEALVEYQKASETAGVVSGLALLNVGRAFELKKENDKAVSTYEKVVSGYGESEYARAARNNLRRLKSPLLLEEVKS